MSDQLPHWRDTDLIMALQQRGYIVRHKSEVRHPLLWHRVAPFPLGLDFKAEAMNKLRELVTPEMVDWVVTPAVASEFEGDLGRPETHSAILRVR